jgi:hypothetical protein
MAGAAVTAVSAHATLSSLPLPLLDAILVALPVDTRLPATRQRTQCVRCREVCRAWRCALDNPCLWQRLDLSPSGGVTHRTMNMLLAAAARARGQLTVLDLSGRQGGGGTGRGSRRQGRGSSASSTRLYV